jgi:hypothetical protein
MQIFLISASERASLFSCAEQHFCTTNTSDVAVQRSGKCVSRELQLSSHVETLSFSRMSADATRKRVDMNEHLYDTYTTRVWSLVSSVLDVCEQASISRVHSHDLWASKFDIRARAISNCTAQHSSVIKSELSLRERVAIDALCTQTETMSIYL